MPEITDEMLATARKALGVAGPLRNQWTEYVTRDTLFHTAIGSGDDNPLWIDEEYARASRWGIRIAPPSFVQAVMYGTRYPKIVTTTGPKPRPMLNGFPGIHSFALGLEFTWHGPFREGDHLKAWSRTLAAIDLDHRVDGDVIEADMDLDAAKAAIETYRGNLPDRAIMQATECEIFREPQHSLACHVVVYNLRIARGVEINRMRYGHLPMPHYSEAQIEGIFDSYLSEARRGRVPLYIEDVQIGDTLPGRIRGPLSGTTMRAVGAASGSNFAMGDGLLQRYLAEHPSAANPDPANGVPDAPNRVHWDTDAAQRVGMPRGYDIAILRPFWFGSYVTDWIGDDAYLRHLAVYFSGPVFLWDTLEMSGTVVDKGTVDGEPSIEIALQGVDPRGDVTTTGKAVAVLPRRAS